MKKDHYLFCPGPVIVSEQVRKALLHRDMGHRVPVFEKIILNVQQNLLKIYKANDEYTILLITGSGTAANETVISSYFTSEDEVLLVNNGMFGSRLEELLRVHNVRTRVLNYEWGEKPQVSDIEGQLRDNPGITSIVMVYHETSTSVINPVTEVGELAHRYGKTYVVDGVSAVGGEDVNVVRDHIDFCTCSSNKCLASFAGVGIICAKKSKIEQTKNNPIKVAYLNLYRLYEMVQTKHQTPNTPSVTMFIALDAAVERLLDEGLEAQINRHKRCARIIRNGLKDLGLKLLVDESIASNTVTSVFLPEKVNQDDFINTLEDRGFTVYAGKGALKKKNVFQIANMGAITEDMCHEFLRVMTDTLKKEVSKVS